MSVLRSQIRRGAYCDSIVLMQLQSALTGLEDVVDSGAVMASEANLALLESSGLRPGDADRAGPGDLLVVVKAESEAAADRALEQVGELLRRRRAAGADEYRPRSLEAAVEMRPEARWVLVSVPGRYAAGVASKALELERHVFLYSDNVALEDEAALKAKAGSKGLLLLGPDCGTAIVGGTGLGFANRVRRGDIGLVGASGTGLQAITSHIHRLGGGVSHALGTGGRDLHRKIGARTARQALDLLSHDPRTRVIVLVSKPPSPAVAARLLSAARSAGKAVVVDFLGYPPPARRIGSLHFATGLAEAAALAVELASAAPAAGREGETTSPRAPAGGYLRGLFSGGTLAHEALQGLRSFLHPLSSNIAMDGVEALADPTRSEAHTIVDLGADELTLGRLHPMIDPDLCLRRLRQEAADPEVGAILLDVVLGDGAAADPAGALAPVLENIREQRGDTLEILAVVVGTEEDPQGYESQVERLREAGARVFPDVLEAVDPIVRRLGRAAIGGEVPGAEGPGAGGPGAGELDGGEVPVDLAGLAEPLVAINAGLESFHSSLTAQGAEALQMDWRPPAGGDERLMALLEKLK